MEGLEGTPVGRVGMDAGWKGLRLEGLEGTSIGRDVVDGRDVGRDVVEGWVGRQLEGLEETVRPNLTGQTITLDQT